MPFKLEKDVGGVQGLHLALDVFDEELEKFIYENGNWAAPFDGPSNSHGGRKRTGTGVGGKGFDSINLSLMNAVRDCGLLEPDSSCANYCLSLTYVKGGSFSPHFDSRYRWGEYVIGVNIGCAAMLVMSQPGKESVKVELPRRSVYVMNGGDARMTWKHGIVKVDDIGPGVEASPAWAKSSQGLAVRRCYTLRCTKSYDEICLYKELKIAEAAGKAENAANLRRRIGDLKAIGAEKSQESKAYTKEEMAKVVENAIAESNEMDIHPLRHCRFPRNHVNFLGSSSVCMATRDLYLPGPLVMIRGSAGYEIRGGDYEGDGHEELEMQAAMQASLVDLSAAGGDRGNFDENADLQKAIEQSLADERRGDKSKRPRDAGHGERTVSDLSADAPAATAPAATSAEELRAARIKRFAGAGGGGK